MKHLILLVTLFICALSLNAQEVMIESKNEVVTVNKKDINTYEFLEVYLFIADFSTKENVFVDTGDNNFKVSNQAATKNQSVWVDGQKVKKGYYRILYKYLLQNGWTKEDTRLSNLGDKTMTIHTFSKFN